MNGSFSEFHRVIIAGYHQASVLSLPSQGVSLALPSLVFGYPWDVSQALPNFVFGYALMCYSYTALFVYNDIKRPASLSA